jgi:hypothetical protein
MGPLRAAASIAGVACLLGSVVCGGKAVMDGPAPGTGMTSSGAGASPGTEAAAGTGVATGAGATGTTTSATTTTSSDPSNGLCQQICGVLASCGAPSSCTTRCQGTAPDCTDRQLPWLECLTATLEPGTCMPSPQCDAAFDEWRGCGLTWHSIHVEIDGATGGCYSSSQIDGGTGSTFEIHCAWTAEAFGCQCTVDAEPAGSCLENMSSPSGPCDPMEGCCAALLFVPFGPPS